LTCARTRRFWNDFFFSIIQNKVKRVKANTNADSDLVTLTGTDATAMAESFVLMLMTNATAEAAVDEFVKTFSALGELNHEFGWFCPMMVAIAKELVSRVAWGVKARSGVGAGLSFFDMASDVYVIMDYFRNGQWEGYALLIMVVTNLFMQLVIVGVQTFRLKRKRRMTMAYEVLSVLTFCKPGLDAYRVSSGAETKPGAVVDPLVEMMSVKIIETVFEAVPVSKFVTLPSVIQSRATR
jgi:hypothetical protein